MMHDLLALLPHWGPWLVAAGAFLSCLMIPVPTSALLLAAGALSGTGHVDLVPLLIGAITGAVLGDLAAFGLARRIEPHLGHRARALLDRARDFILRRGPLAVFLSRWLITPLGPASNYAAGAAGMRLAPFAAASIAGEALWAWFHLFGAHLAARAFRGHDQAALIAVGIGLALAALLFGVRLIWRKRGRPTI